LHEASEISGTLINNPSNNSPIKTPFNFGKCPCHLTLGQIGLRKWICVFRINEKSEEGRKRFIFVQ